MGDEGSERRRIPHASDKPAENKMGCIVWGAVLGVVVGGMFAAYGLKPILRHYYGETAVAVGAAYEGDAKQLQVVSAGTGRPASAKAGAPEGGYWVVVEVTTNKTWAPGVADFSVEFGGVEDWVGADWAQPSAGGVVEFGLAEPTTVILHFPLPLAGAAGEFLHVKEPRLKFDLAK